MNEKLGTLRLGLVVLLISGCLCVRALSQDTEQRRLVFVSEKPPAAAVVLNTSEPGGSVDAGDHEYVVTFVTAIGETQSGPPAKIQVDGRHKVRLTQIPISPGSTVVARRLYRSKARETGNRETDKYYLLTTLRNNVDTVYVDSVPDASLTESARLLQNNTTGGVFLKNGLKSGFIGETNTFLGLGSGNVLTGSYNTTVGVRSLGSTGSAGDFNTVVGFEGMIANQSGDLNTCIGSQCLFSNTSGRGNTAAGETALNGNSTGSENVAIGWQALREPKATSHNVAVGPNALRGTPESKGTANVGLGYGALYAFTSGEANVAVGLSAGANITTGSFNSPLGHQSLNRTITGSRNVGVGVNSGITNTVGSDNTLVGSFADVATANLQNATAVGANARVGQSNALVLGNNVDVGIGTSTPKARLEVDGGGVLVGTPGQGIILRSPDGKMCGLLSLNNAGALVTNTVNCP